MNQYKRKPMKGKVFGRLVVLFPAGHINDYDKYRWYCVCQCGTFVCIEGAHLRSGNTRSCGCINKTNPPGSINLVGEKFGLLTVEKLHNKKTKDRKRLWVCSCACGNSVVVLGNSLRSGVTKSCGCLRKRKGKDSPLWNHELALEDRLNRRSLEGLAEWRVAVYTRDNYACVLCTTQDKLQAHHKNGWNWCEEGRVDVTNGVTLCENCHRDFHRQYGNRNNTEEQWDEYVLQLWTVA